jgi:hypothetical protein
MSNQSECSIISIRLVKVSRISVIGPYFANGCFGSEAVIVAESRRQAGFGQKQPVIDTNSVRVSDCALSQELGRPFHYFRLIIPSTR